MSQELPVGTAFEKALQGESQDVPEGGPFLTFYFNPEDIGISPPYRLGAVHKLNVVFGTAVFPRPTGYLPVLTGRPEVLGYGKTEDGLYFLTFSYEGLGEEIEKVMGESRFLCHWAAAGVVRVESSLGTRFDLTQARFRGEPMVERDGLALV